MARFVYEFFRPWGPPALYPLGVLAQDEQGIEYRELPGAGIPDGFKTGFFLLSGRGPFIREQLLPRLGITDSSDPAVFAVLRDRATHRFLYSQPEDATGSAAEVATAQAARLADPAALAQLTDQHHQLALTE
ncbi:MAG TPA: hypothetical protein VH637_09670 [Streptosporangiaceae bacterium]|jgi:hypothetical protein